MNELKLLLFCVISQSFGKHGIPYVVHSPWQLESACVIILHQLSVITHFVKGAFKKIIDCSPSCGLTGCYCCPIGQTDHFEEANVK